MLHYSKGKNVEEELSKDDTPFDSLPEKFLWMQVNGGTKIANVVNYAKEKFSSGEHNAVIWVGSGGGVGKTISCAEVMKRTYEAPLHQITKLKYRQVEEFWEPQTNGLEQIVAKRQIPCVFILLSLNEIDSNTSGYQNSKVKTTYWLENNSTNFTPKTKRDGNNIYNKKTRSTDGASSSNNNSNATSSSGPSNNNNNNNKKKNKFKKNKNQTELN